MHNLLEKIRIILSNRVYRWVLYVILFLCLAFIYFSFLPTITFDSTVYYKYLDIFNGKTPLSNWDAIRGPTLPAILFVISMIFGDSPTGFLIGTFLLYLCLMVVLLLIMKCALTKIKKDNIKIFCYLAFLVFIVFNPLIIGYYHAMLTEFVATTIFALCCSLAYKWQGEKFVKSKKLKYLSLVIAFCILVVLMWFLKQPYVFVALGPLLISSLVSILKDKTWANIASKIVGVLLCLASLIVSVSVWNAILVSGGANSPNGANQWYLSSQITKGLSDYQYVNESFSGDIIAKLSSSDVKEINKIKAGSSQYKSYQLFRVVNINGNMVDGAVLFQKQIGQPSFIESCEFIAESALRHPLLAVDSYVSDYLTISGVYSYREANQTIYPVKTLINTRGQENVNIGLAAYKNGPIYQDHIPTEQLQASGLESYIVDNNPNFVAQLLVFIPKYLSIILFRLAFLILPIMLAWAIFKRCKSGQSRYSLVYELVIILLGSSFIHVMAHVLTGALIDRYAFVALPTAILGAVILIASIVDGKLGSDMSYTDKKAIKILGVKIDNINKQSLVLFLDKAFNDSTRKTKIFKINPEFIQRALRDATFKKVLNSSDINIIDGRGVMWATKYLSLPSYQNSWLRFIQAIWQMFYSGASLVFRPNFIKVSNAEVIPGIEAFNLMVRAAIDSKSGIFIFGGSQDTLDLSIKNLKTKFPKLRIAGSLNGYDFQDNGEIDPVAKINETDAKLLIVALGSPRQEYWINDNLSKLKNVNITVGEGGTLDRIAYPKQKAPRFINRIGLEWVWRAFFNKSKTNTRSSWQRLWVSVPSFIYKVVKWKVEYGNKKVKS